MSAIVIKLTFEWWQALIVILVGAPVGGFFSGLGRGAARSVTGRDHEPG